MDKSDGSSTSRDPTILCILFSYFFFLFLFFPSFVLDVGQRERMHGEKSRCSREYIFSGWARFCNFF